MTVPLLYDLARHIRYHYLSFLLTTPMELYKVKSSIYSQVLN